MQNKYYNEYQGVSNATIKKRVIIPTISGIITRFQ